MNHEVKKLLIKNTNIITATERIYRQSKDLLREMKSKYSDILQHNRVRRLSEMACQTVLRFARISQYYFILTQFDQTTAMTQRNIIVSDNRRLSNIRICLL